MIWRRVPPVVSPIATRSILAATRGATRGTSRVSTTDLAARFEADECLLTDSGTSALVIALRLSVPRGAVVAFPAYACIDIIAAAQRADVRVALYDMHPETLGPDLDSVRRTLRTGARALLAAPLFGYPQDMGQLAAVASEHDVPLIEDAAQAAGGRIGGRRIGAFGDVSVLSFGRGKGMTTGNGGALLLRGVRASEWGARAREQMRPGSRGMDVVIGLAAQWLLARPGAYGIPAAIPALKLGEMVYRPAHEPREMSAAATSVLPTALAMDDLEVRRRQQRATQYLSAIDGARLRAICSSPDAQPGYLRLALLRSSDARPADARLGITRGYPVTLDEHPETGRVLAHSPMNIDGARQLRDRLLTLPTHSRVDAADAERIVSWLKDRGMRAT